MIYGVLVFRYVTFSFYNSLISVCSILFLALTSALYLPTIGKDIAYGSRQGGGLECLCPARKCLKLKI